MNLSNSAGFKNVDSTTEIILMNYLLNAFRLDKKVRRKGKPKGVDETHLNFDQFDFDIWPKAYGGFHLHIKTS